MNQPNVQTGTPVPPHIRPESVVDYDFYSDRRHDEVGDIHLALHRMAEEECRGIFWTPQNGGHWIINDYELLFEAARDPGLFSSSALTLPPMPAGLEPRVVPVGLDPPVHGPYRMPLMKGFSPDRIRALEGDIRAFAVELIERVAADGACDFVEAIAEPMPVIIFMKMMGMDTTRLREFRGWVYDMLSNDNDRRARSHLDIANARVEFGWAGSFGVTDTGLPKIGRVPEMPNCWAALGYGGNGTTYARIAADVIRGALINKADADADLYGF